jgi:small-conductance mechanosensitive channel
MPSDWFTFVGPQSALEVFGVRLVGFNAENGKKLVFTLVVIAALVLLRVGLRALTSAIVLARGGERVEFWTRQGINLAIAVLLVLGIASIWFDDPTRLATALGLVTAGLAFALQKVITAIAGYFVILRGRTFNVGDRIVMGGVRGDVIALDFTRTTIMEMGQPPSVQAADPAMWVRSRQYTGRIVTVSNAKIFDEPVYNYTREFPYIWDELILPISYDADAQRVERILLDAARHHGVGRDELTDEALQEMERRYATKPAELEPAVYQRLTDNWLELTVRFVARDHGVRAMKDKMSREILQGLKAAGIGVASATFEIVGLPPLRVDRSMWQGIRRDGDTAAGAR